mgnify:CR=1 FL=1
MRFRGPFSRLEDRLSAGPALEPGLYHFQRGGQYGSTRYHLRVEPNGKGILSINAQKVVHLNQSATEYAMLILEGADEKQAVRRLKSRYRVRAPVVRRDFLDLKEKIETLGEEKGICPVTYLGLERVEPFQTPSSAPYRLDFALTYRCNNHCPHCYVERPRDFPEMNSDRWKTALERAWELGIPHVVFTGGEATLRPDLVELIEYAENLGLITGLLTNGRNLGKDVMVEKLVDSGLDHIQITIESHLEEIHDDMVGCRGAWRETVRGIEAVLSTPIYTISNTTITASNRGHLLDTVDFLAHLGLQAIAMNGVIYTGGARDSLNGIREEELGAVLESVRDRAADCGLRFIWYTPTRYCRLDPVALGLGPKQCTAGKYNMCVEPNGDVIPCQSYYEPLGNLLDDDWETIWGSETCAGIRERRFAPGECLTCETFHICGAGCPLYPEKDTLVCVESKSSS